MSWIEDLKLDENKELRKIYSDYRSECISWLKSNYSLSENEGIETFQNAVIILYDNVMQGKIINASSTLKSYLFSIAKNKAYEMLRRKKQLVSSDEYDLPAILVEDDYAIEIKLKKEEQYKSVDIGLTKLGDPCKTLLQLFYYKKMKMDEIKTLMAYESRDSVKTAKYKCIKRLKKMVA